jgi:hypothetical protein
MAPATSASERGRAMRSGAQRSSRAQFVQTRGTPWVSGYYAADSAACSTRSGRPAQWASASTGVSRR